MSPPKKKHFGNILEYLRKIRIEGTVKPLWIEEKIFTHSN